MFIISLIFTWSFKLYKNISFISFKSIWNRTFIKDIYKFENYLTKCELSNWFIKKSDYLIYLTIVIKTQYNFSFKKLNEYWIVSILNRDNFTYDNWNSNPVKKLLLTLCHFRFRQFKFITQLSTVKIDNYFNNFIFPCWKFNFFMTFTIYNYLNQILVH